MDSTELQSRQFLIKAITRCIAVFDLVHVIFPIVFFSNLSVFGAVVLFGPKRSYEQQRVLMYFVPVGVVGIVAFSYGVIVAIRLFDSTHPEIRPLKSADMAMWWWHYSIALVVLHKVGAAIYFYLGGEEHIVADMLSLITNVSVSIRAICILIVRKFIKTMRRKELPVSPVPTSANHLHTEIQKRRSSVRWQLPAASIMGLGESSVSLPSPTARKQNLFQMLFITKILIIVDLMQNTFMVIMMVYTNIAWVNVILKAPNLRDHYIGWSTAVIILGMATMAVFSYGIFTGLRLHEVTDELAECKQLHELPEPVQDQLSRTVRNWLLSCLGCIVMTEVISLTMIISFVSIPALVYSGSLSFSFAIRVVTHYLVRRFRKHFFRKGSGSVGGEGLSNGAFPGSSHSRRKVAPAEESAQKEEKRTPSEDIIRDEEKAESPPNTERTQFKDIVAEEEPPKENSEVLDLALEKV